MSRSIADARDRTAVFVAIIWAQTRIALTFQPIPFRYFAPNRSWRSALLTRYASGGSSSWPHFQRIWSAELQSQVSHDDSVLVISNSATQ